MKRPVKSSGGGMTNNEASRAYRELERKFLEKNRLAGETKRKPASKETSNFSGKLKLADERKPEPTSTAQNQFHKTTCRNCGVHVEYPCDAEGQIAPCPMCGTNLTLSVWCVDGISGDEAAIKNGPPQGDSPLSSVQGDKRCHQVERERLDIKLRSRLQHNTHFTTTPPPAIFANNGQNTSSNVGNTDGNKNSASMPSNTVGWIGKSIVAVICLCIFAWFFPSLYRMDRAIVVGTISGQPYRVKIDNYLRERANDPSSVEIINLGQPSIPWSDGLRRVECTFRAKNAFGALVLSVWDFSLDENNNIINAHDTPSSSQNRTSSSQPTQVAQDKTQPEQETDKPQNNSIENIERDVQQDINESYTKQPAFVAVRVLSVKLSRISTGIFTGIAEVQCGEDVQRLDVNVTSDGQITHWTRTIPSQWPFQIGSKMSQLAKYSDAVTPKQVYSASLSSLEVKYPSIENYSTFYESSVEDLGHDYWKLTLYGDYTDTSGNLGRHRIITVSHKEPIDGGDAVTLNILKVSFY